VDGREVGGEVFDTAPTGKNTRDPEVWSSFDVVLPQGQVTLTLSKHENKNSSGTSRLVDCLLLTMDEDLVPNHLHFGAQTFVRVTLGDTSETLAFWIYDLRGSRSPLGGTPGIGAAGAAEELVAERSEAEAEENEGAAGSERRGGY
ncbi:MAG: hypothetical protein WCR59_12320, partial [Planctomycetota bacterium]